jgi:adenine phosphoribosyltransferase
MCVGIICLKPRNIVQAHFCQMATPQRLAFAAAWAKLRLITSLLGCPMLLDLKNHIRAIPDFPKPGILFYDISTLLAHPVAWRTAIDRLTEELMPYKPDVLVGIDARGFLLAAPLAIALNTGFIMVRKQGKLPGKTIPLAYALEYGSNIIEIQEDAIKPGQRVVILDDLLATGGTAAAAVQLCQQVGAEVVCAAFIIELAFLGGRAKCNVPTLSLLRYDS